ncbi:hypothetical protein AAFF_G00404960 [Aldrovandia affinis]|uniref:Glycoprotein-N-acetylgalactosamine 3-beta-galactosyltransferase 1 n=1 Tax=Aldrovandia affinis TaxID=143900 RepID=A0AAD7T7N1_9TELE|nr:hypothetical protein AAFF_G00404960 [Aldrovandia affinis]
MPFFVCGLFLGFVGTYIVLQANLVSNTYHRTVSQKSDKPVDTMNIGMTDISLTEGTIKDMTKDRSAKVRVLCWIMTSPLNLQEKTRHVRATWTTRCDKVLFMSSKETDFPTVGLNVSEGREQLYWKTVRAFQYIHKNHFDDADWFLKADDDTYVVLDNLRYLLSKYDTEQPIYFGSRFRPFVTQGYMSGGAGYVLSKEALRRFVEGFRVGKCTHTTHVEDVALGNCMETMRLLSVLPQHRRS